MKAKEPQIVAYIAGIMDGEGTITLSKIHKTSKFRAPVVSVSSTSYEILNFIHSYYGGSIINQKTYKKHHKNSRVWKTTYTNALKFLSDIYPYLLDKTKRYRAHLLITKYKSVTPRNGRYSKSLERAKQQFEHDFFHPSTTIEENSLR
jgi:intein/homing endonuclease